MAPAAQFLQQVTNYVVNTLISYYLANVNTGTKEMCMKNIRNEVIWGKINNLAKVKMLVWTCMTDAVII